jgi:hypothetical protein
MSESRHYYYPVNVKFIGDYFVMTISVTVSVDADEDLHSGEIQDRAVDLANEVLYDHYGWQDVDSVSNQVEVELREGY